MPTDTCRCEWSITEFPGCGVNKAILESSDFPPDHKICRRWGFLKGCEKYTRTGVLCVDRRVVGIIEHRDRIEESPYTQLVIKWADCGQDPGRYGCQNPGSETYTPRKRRSAAASAVEWGSRRMEEFQKTQEERVVLEERRLRGVGS